MAPRAPLLFSPCSCGYDRGRARGAPGASFPRRPPWRIAAPLGTFVSSSPDLRHLTQLAASRRPLARRSLKRERAWERMRWRTVIPTPAEKQSGRGERRTDGCLRHRSSAGSPVCCDVRAVSIALGPPDDPGRQARRVPAAEPRGSGVSREALGAVSDAQGLCVCSGCVCSGWRPALRAARSSPRQPRCAPVPRHPRGGVSESHSESHSESLDGEAGAKRPAPARAARSAGRPRRKKPEGPGYAPGPSDAARGPSSCRGPPSARSTRAAGESSLASPPPLRRPSAMFR